MEIQGCPNYLIYPDGRVFSKSRPGTNGSTLPSRFLKSCDDGNGYLFVGLNTNKKINRKINRKIHRLVAIHYIPNPENKREVDHIDRDKSNNDISNLRWVTSKENCMNRTPKRVQKNNRLGEKNISQTTYGNYRVVIKRKDLSVDKSFKTLEEAIKYRDFILSP